MEPRGDDARPDRALRRHFEAFAATAHPRAPLYAALSTIVARDPSLRRLLDGAAPEQRMPVLLFASIHFVLLGEPDAELARWYRTLTPEPRSPDDLRLAPALRRFVDEHRDHIGELVATRSTQTNEVGRCSLLLPALGLLAAEVGALGLLDVGASAGLNLLLDRYQYHYRTGDGAAGGTVVVGGRSSVTLPCGTRGAVPIPAVLPEIRHRCGLDRRPIDVTDPVEARWLEACVWPDQADRFHRLAHAIELARRHPPEVLAGDAVIDLAAGIDRVGDGAHPVVTNSWVLNYLSPGQRIDYLDTLERAGAERDLSWVYAEAPALIPELPNEPDPVDAHRTVLSLVRWRSGTRTVTHLATCHPHGFWIHWRGS